MLFVNASIIRFCYLNILRFHHQLLLLIVLAITPGNSVSLLFATFYYPDFSVRLIHQAVEDHVPPP